jgi:hypothetical protein
MAATPGVGSRFSLIWLTIFTLFGLPDSKPAHAYPSGRDIYYHGGPLQLEILTSDSAYTSRIYLHTATERIFLGANSDAGVVLNLADPSAVGLNPGDEFVLGIYVNDTGKYFALGGGYDNPDGVVHASVTYLPDNVAIIGFEDLFGGGDLDYNDARVRIAGNIGLVAIPEPSALLLIASGVVGLWLFRRRPTIGKN